MRRGQHLIKWIKRKKQEKPKVEKERDENYSSDALDGHATIESWERDNGRGFWGNSTTGYLTDEQVNNM